MDNVLLGVFLTVAGLAAGCGGNSGRPPAGPLPAATTTTATTLATAPDTDPGDVCAGFSRAILTVDTRRDSGPGDAYRRATPYVTGQLTRPVSAAAAPDAQWATWRAHQAATVVRTDAGQVEAPPDTTALARRAIAATVTPTGADGWAGPTTTTVVYCQLTRTAAGWRVESYALG